MGPREESLDQVCQVMVGLALCAKFIPPGTFVNDPSGLPKQFEEGTGAADILTEVKVIATRIVNWIRINSWNIRNPVTLSCVKANAWDREDRPGCKCGDGGADFQPFSFGLAQVYSRIMVAPAITNDALAGTFYAAAFGSDPIVTTSATQWLTILHSSSIGKEDYKVLSLAAAGHAWGISTGGVLQVRCAHEFVSSGPHRQNPGERLHLPLLHQAIYGIYHASYPPDFYKCIMDHAQCYNVMGQDGNEIWSEDPGLIFNGYNATNYSAEYNGLSYMFYFNIYNLTYPTYLPGYKFYKPFDLCEDNILKQNWTESDQKHFIASNSITAQGLYPSNPDPANQGKYIVENDNDPQPFPLSRADITFMAKKEVHLGAGFEAHAGTRFQAIINPSLNSMECNTPNAALVSDCDGYLVPFKSSQHQSTTTLEELREAYSKFQEVPKEEASTHIEKNSGYTIIPNPNNGQFNISVNFETETNSKTIVLITDVIGNLVFEKILDKNYLTVDISMQPKGLYFVKFICGNLITVEKVIHQ
ncbi:MAG: T9SS type A sorting domain-containing protein [Bacteroidota bacterium]|nr:T9SS type A sorting domain-containing protein [Bacteroidota bacterium]